MGHFSFLDTFIHEVDTALRTLCPPSQRTSARSSPAESIPDAQLTAQEKKHVAGLMRVNHSGEVCAQALYQGQGLTANLLHVKQQMAAAAAEEVDHLAWCEERLEELAAAPSLLNPLWYTGSFILGALAGWAGDTLSLGFVAETEKQVSEHLHKHLEKLPPHDVRTQKILAQMQQDEAQHAQSAMQAGGVALPFPITLFMRMVSKIMTKSSYHI
ncbi:MAG: demethoxyubiquinone hydroxylase family protein [Legionella sp. 40-6]|nr:2-polyprenyl-3-methyl-6-methoxy-1,4-benzoquinone monooxygenase [Legionella sp.]OJY46288.1 MAG: demethoxyubiquinone hydroxylase family protein [Legionella sp. 40-6]